MEYKNTFLSEHYVYNCNLSLPFRNTSFDKLAFDRRERVGRIRRKHLVLLRWQEFETRLVAVFLLTCHRGAGGGGQCQDC